MKDERVSKAGRRLFSAQANLCFTWAGGERNACAVEDGRAGLAESDALLIATAAAGGCRH